jgi:hypothetical protein
MGNNGKATSGAVGAAGELVAQAALLMRGWVAGNVNSGGMMNAPAVDLVAVKGDVNIRIAAKACGPSGSLQWSQKPGWTTLFKGDARPDYMIVVWFHDAANYDVHRTFIVPADVVDKAVLASHTLWHSLPRRDGQPRKLTNHVMIRMNGKDKEAIGVGGNNFAEKWKQYEGNWDQLETNAESR